MGASMAKCRIGLLCSSFSAGCRHHHLTQGIQRERRSCQSKAKPPECPFGDPDPDPDRSRASVLAVVAQGGVAMVRGPRDGKAIGWRSARCGTGVDDRSKVG